MDYRFDPELADIIRVLPASDYTDLPTVRSEINEFLSAIQPDTEGVHTTDLRVPGPPGEPDCAVRIYRPAEVNETTAAIVNIHGGGFMVGNVDIDDENCRHLVRALGVVVVSVDYRLAPEDPFPAALEDCYAALEWTAKNVGQLGVDPARIAVYGRSAGGGLAAGLALLTRDRGGPALCFQFLAIPELDDRLTTPSMRKFVDTPVWNRPNAVISWNAYLGDGVPGTENVSPYAAPARATDLNGLPPAYISAMEFDPLRDEGVAYAQALLAAGVPTELHLFPGTFHGSTLMGQARVSQREKDEALAVLGAVLGRPGEDRI
ncbi:alpha/beta hydrolase [Pseudofrankia inefficax]|uniref:Lipase/esterase n=1 Tax=Pseudofrankia inefficax (strain DSM 45817 / CECT 9037 / DDB 130130 / EuI1c) TaxID=298654 RepID=E3J9P5_PSEI1|nr:alpha/beta hydrolase [Pseudofrankia inefficax]ADP84548.1 lipase/esterase [Pseudofrankia inefficax]